MLRKEQQSIILISAILVGLILFKFQESEMITTIYMLVLPLYFFLTFIKRFILDGSKRISNAVSTCIEDNEFDVVDNMEHLRLFFDDTGDIISFLTVVDPRILTYAFSEENISMDYREYIIGATKCIGLFMGFNGSFHYSINSILISDSDRIISLLSTLYQVSREIELGTKDIHISYRKYEESFQLDVTDRYVFKFKDVFLRKHKILHRIA